MKIGVLAMQGDFREHVQILKRLNVQTIEVRWPQDMELISGLIIPGGESTSIGLLLKKTGLEEEISRRHREGMPIYGSCAGAIVLAKEIVGSAQPRLGLADITVSRNSYGRQADSFEADIRVKGWKKPFHAIFIRSLKVTQVGKDVEVLAEHGGLPVLLRQGNLLISTFHPELTVDKRIHHFFISMVRRWKR